MKAHIIALGVGALVGVIYGILQVKPPAPPVIALVGLLGILGGEQAVVFIRSKLESTVSVVQKNPVSKSEDLSQMPKKS